MTVTGLTLGENLERWTQQYGELPVGQDVIRPLDRPIKTTGHIRFDLSFNMVKTRSQFENRILKGNLAPGGAVAKITGKEGLGFTGKARAFDTEDDFVHAVESGSIKKGEKTVVVLRYLGPKGGPGKTAILCLIWLECLMMNV
jgi:dihydroxy-acid dehydratase